MADKNPEIATQRLPQKKARRIGVFPGSFDPLHNGHLDLILRGRVLFDELVVAVLNNEHKSPLFSVAERVEMLEELLANYPDCRVESFSGLLVDFADKAGACALVRGLRSGTDLDYELPMTFMNRRLRPDVETLFLLPHADTLHLSSSLIKEVIKLQGEASDAVPEAIHDRLVKKLAGGGG